MSNATLQYFRPGGPHFVGDCMPFSHDGLFHLFYLLDENHHQGLGGLGGHQWAHASTRDLIHWEHHPLALAIEHDWEKSICTGSTFFHAGVYHAFFATRKPDWTQHLGHAVSDDGVHFCKLSPNPFASAPPGYSVCDLRDPFVFQADDGLFHMLVTSKLSEFRLKERGGCLLRYTSTDLYDWQVAEPLLIFSNERGYGCVPECPDLFFWNGWYYLLFGLNLATRYRMSRSMFGPWTRPPIDSLDNGMNAVMKSAAFGARRIAVGWIGSRAGDKDAGDRQWGGRTVFRELVPNADGTLGTKFVPEMTPVGDAIEPFKVAPLTPQATFVDGVLSLSPQTGMAVAAVDSLSSPYVLRCTFTITPGTAAVGVVVRGSGAFETGYTIRFDAFRRTLSLQQQSVPIADIVSGQHTLELVVRDHLVDVCLDGRQCLIDTCTELHGDRLFFFCEDGAAQFASISILKL